MPTWTRSGDYWILRIPGGDQGEIVARAEVNGTYWDVHVPWEPGVRYEDLAESATAARADAVHGIGELLLQAPPRWLAAAYQSRREHVSQAVLGRQLGVDQSAVSRWLAGRQLMSTPVRILIMRELGLTTDGVRWTLRR